MTPKEIEGFTERDLLIEVYTKLELLCDELVHLREQVHGNGQLKDRVSKLEERTSPTKAGSVGGAIAAALAIVIIKILEKIPLT